MEQLIELNKDFLIGLCQKYHVESFYAIGSILTEKFDRESDIDFLVRFGNVDLLEYGDNYFELQSKLEQLFNRKVDLVIEKDLQNEVLIKELNRTKKKIYESPNSKVVN